jgi:hypothetical protein
MSPTARTVTQLVLAALVLYARPALADQSQTLAPKPIQSAVPTPSGPAASGAYGAPKLPPNFDPCGGPQELLNKFGTTPCVVPLGEVMLSGGYSSAKVTGNVALGSIATMPVSALARQFPQSVITVGVTPQTDFEFAGPSYLRLDTPSKPWLAQGATDSSFEIKQQVAFNPFAAEITSITLQVKLDTGSPSLRAASPAYALGVLQSKAWPSQHLTLIGNADVAYGPTSGPMPVQRASAGATGLALWTSPGNFLASVGAVYNTSSGVLMPLAAVEQLVNRHVGLQLYYAGMGAGFAQTTQVALPMINSIQTKGNVNVVGGSFVLLAGHGGPGPGGP